ncbi:MAG: hypothetical protein ACRDZX_06485 [Acidimicrobiales bacterium]
MSYDSAHGDDHSVSEAREKLSEVIDAFDAAIAEEGDNIPWDQVKADLGWS